MEGTQQTKQIVQIVGFGDGPSRLFQKGFAVFFSGLLAVKTKFIVKPLAAGGDGFGEAVIFFCFAHPLAGGFFHKELFPWS